MFSPQFMSFIIDPNCKSNSSAKTTIPNISDDKTIKSDIDGIRKFTYKLAALDKDRFLKKSET